MEIRVKNGVFLVDDEDVTLHVQGRGWTVNSGGYVHATIQGIQRPLHRLLMGLEPGDPRQVDHINGNRLDNRRCNLRVCTARENRRNARKRKDNTSGFKGVIRVGRDGTYRAVLAIGGFSSAEEAAKVYDTLAEVAYGEYAHLNFPKQES
jgi:hypothetical protein